MNRSRTWGAIGILAATVALSACREAEASRDNLVLDSAGVAIVENRGAVWSGESAWRVDPVPEVEIGGLDAAPEYAVHDVAGALRLDDGRIVIADRGSMELRLYDENGVYLESKGGPGGGPGEFQTLWTLTRYRSDSLMIWDSGNIRFSVHDQDGDFHRTFKLQPGPEAQPHFPGPRILALEDGSILGFEWLSPMNQPEGLYRPVVDYIRFSPTGEPGDVALSVPFREWMLARFDPGIEMRMSGPPTTMTELLFARESFLSIHDGTIWVGRAAGAEFALEAYGGDGTLLRRVENTTFSPVPVEPGHVEAEIEGRLAEAERMRERMPAMDAYVKKQKETLEKLPAPEFFPPYQDLRTATDGHVWVQAYAPPGVEPTLWSVFDPEGRLLGEITLPESFAVTDLGPDYVLGTFVDELDVQHVRLHRLIQPGS